MDGAGTNPHLYVYVRVCTCFHGLLCTCIRSSVMTCYTYAQDQSHAPRRHSLNPALMRHPDNTDAVSSRSSISRRRGGSWIRKKLTTHSEVEMQSSTDDLIFDDLQCLRLTNSSLVSRKILANFVNFERSVASKTYEITPSAFCVLPCWNIIGLLR